MFATKLVRVRTKWKLPLLLWRWPLYRANLHPFIFFFCHPKRSKCQNDMFCFSRLMSPPSECCFSICIGPRRNAAPTVARAHTNTRAHKLHPENYITSPPLSENYICPSPFHQSLPRSASPPPPPPSPCLTILGFFLHFNSALNCQAWIALWTAWGGQAGRRCVWMRESLLSPSLFIFLSKWCCQEPNKISLSARPPTESHNTTSRKWNKKE